MQLDAEDQDSVFNFIRELAQKQGAAEFLAEGPFKAAQILGKQSLNQIKPASRLLSMQAEAGPHLRPQAGSSQNFKVRGLPLRIACDEFNFMLADILGVSGFKTEADEAESINKLADLVNAYTGLAVTGEKLKSITGRCYALTRFFNYRESGQDPAQAGTAFHADLPPLYHIIEDKNSSLEQLLCMVADYYRSRGWKLRELFTPGTFKKLGISELFTKAGNQGDKK